MNAAEEYELSPVADGTDSPLAHARLHRQLTVEEAARRAGLQPDEVRWLEQGRVYRFPSPDHALLATVLYASALGIDHDEALALAGLPVPPRPLRRNPWARLAVLAAIAGALVSLVTAVEVAGRHGSKAAVTKTVTVPTLPAPWTITVPVLNGSGDINTTRRLASRVQALGYHVTHVGPANNFRYRQTTVFYPPGGEAIALRLAKQICANVAPLPGGRNPRRLVVIAGPATIGTC
jgi:transcriptional regulator with XRE-family HTH domain